MELARELFAIVQITSVRHVINDISPDDLKIWIRRYQPTPLTSASPFVDEREAGKGGSSSEKTSWFSESLSTWRFGKARKILEFNSNRISSRSSLHYVDARNI